MPEPNNPNNEDGLSLSDIGHGALDIVGIIPVVGEAADVTNAVWYAAEEKYLDAGLSLISVIPVVGDVIGKGGKIASKLGPEAAQKVLQAVKKLDIPKFLDKFKDNEKIAPHLEKISKALKKWQDDLAKKFSSGKAKKGTVKCPKVSRVPLKDFAETVKEFRDGKNPELAKKAHELFEEKNWTELEKLFKKHNLNGGYPPNNGAISTKTVTLKPGQKIDRYGKPTGKFVSSAGSSFESRALPNKPSEPPKIYEVIKEIPNVKKGKIIPWFGQKGMGTQYEFDRSIKKLKKGGFIKEITK